MATAVKPEMTAKEKDPLFFVPPPFSLFFCFANGNFL